MLHRRGPSIALQALSSFDPAEQIRGILEVCR
jgi:hypothetical protein